MSAEPLTRMLERLPRAEPDAARADRVRARCHAALAGQRAVHRAPQSSPAVYAWKSVIIGGACLAYLSQVLRQALHLYGFL